MNEQCAWYDPFWCDASECEGCASFIGKGTEQQLMLEI